MVRKIRTTEQDEQEGKKELRKETTEYTEGTEGNGKNGVSPFTLELNSGDVYSMSVYLSLPSFAKVNLHLRILGKREDGYHDIFTVFQTVSLCDRLAFECVEGEITLECDDSAVPIDGSNLIIRAAERLRAKFGVSDGVRMKLEKRIPMGGGLGGGSSNAAAALIGLSKI